MKKNVLGIICLSLCISTSLFADDKKTIKSKLDAVTVFFQGAELNHSASGTLSRGENEIYIEGLSPNIDVNSLKIKASNSVIISSYEFSVDYLSESKVVSPASKRLLDSIDFYQKKVEQLNTDITVTNNLISLLQKGTDKNVAGSENGLGIDELVKTMDYYKTKSTELQLTQSDNNKKKKTYDEALSRLRNQLSQETTKNNKTSGVLKLTLAAPVATASNFTISYYTSAANWVPYYDITVVSTDKPITIAAKSKVRQTTGLDWEKVKLTLSTATPSNGKTAPLFSAWFLKEYTYGQVGINQLSGRVAGLAVQNSYSFSMINPILNS
ncbi:mucoidy inhibitor MuiA family protein [Dysgonomonas macrotermitis]|uniref:DUF4139 domain-containing protein n=1 Tax=Dysgonomonas macrotermitis TaxID=1346286 RepID=A0A1M4WZC4_9BACT|nr:mucoidy inhibitor MuiA family protein [Dysgonomonas macrotermitis]SHE86322.1 conserved hypothetical protein [Dysgonomonas macrotermitis]